MTDLKFKQLKYNKARLAIMGVIAGKNLRIGDNIPSTRDFIEMLPYGAITIRRALADLTNEGLIERRPGSGTYLSKELSANRFASNILYIYVAKREESVPGPAVDPLRHALADKGIGLNIISVYEFGMDVIEAAKNSFAVLLTGWLSEDFLLKVKSLQQPMIIIGSYRNTLSIPYVSHDVECGAYRLTKELIKEGHKNILLFGSKKDNYFTSFLYRQGYERAMNEYGMKQNIFTPESLLSAGSDLDLFMEHCELPDAILMEFGMIYDFMSWCWRTEFGHYPAISFLSEPINFRRYRQSPKWRCVTFANPTLRSAELLLANMLDDAPLVSEMIPPYIPGVDDDNDYFIN